MSERTFLGYAPIYAGDRGDLLVDTDAVSGDVGYDDDEFGYDDDDIEVGAPAFVERMRERRAKRKGKRADRKRRRANKLDAKAGKLRAKNRGNEPEQDHEEGSWVGTVLSGSESLTAAGAWTVTMRPQHDFRANDISFPGSSSGCEVNAVYFGDRPVWQSTDGVDVSFFASTGFIRNILDGQEIRAGLDIKVTGTLAGEGDAKVVIVGEKPFISSC